MRELRLGSGYNYLYPKVESFIQHDLFTVSVDLEDPNTIRNLSEPNVVNNINLVFKKTINNLTIRSKGDDKSEITLNFVNQDLL
jgi:type III restriction enzyme